MIDPVRNVPSGHLAAGIDGVHDRVGNARGRVVDRDELAVAQQEPMANLVRAHIPAYNIAAQNRDRYGRARAGDIFKLRELPGVGELAPAHYKVVVHVIGEVVRSKNVAVGVHGHRVRGHGSREVDGREDTVRAEHKAVVRTATVYTGGVIAEDVAAGTDSPDLGESSAGEIDGDELASAQEKTMRRFVGARVEPDDIAT